MSGNSHSSETTHPVATDVDATIAVPVAAPAAVDLGRIGPFRLLEHLGDGGMGTVYLAEQTQPLRRRVALKLIRAVGADNATLRRFEAERQALARMSHANIAQVYESGETVDGRPYIAMEHVPGPPITNYCDRQRSTLEYRIKLFLAVCDGVQHAHQKAVIHRDLKPTNLLVAEGDGRTVPKVIDFGVAKGVGAPLTPVGPLTLDTGVVGTPFYLSPEAARGENSVDIDTRADIYSLGVVLFELLTGVGPFDDQDRAILFRRISSGDYRPPSETLARLPADRRHDLAELRRLDPAAHARALSGDLDWIVCKAMATEPFQRYASAAEMAADLRRHLNNEPVSVSPPSRMYRFFKFARRHRTVLGAAAIVAVAVVGGLAARALEAERANREAARANLEAEAAREVAAFLAGLFRISSPGDRRPSEITARELLDDGAKRVREGLAEQPLVRARLMETIGDVYRTLSLYDSARPLLHEALELRRRELPADDPVVAESLEALATLAWDEGRYADAVPLNREVLAIRRGGDDGVALADSLMALANSVGNLGDFSEAESLYREALELRERHLGPDHEKVAAVLNNLANLCFDLKRYAEAESLHLRSIAIKEKELGPDHFFVGQALNNLANVYLAQERFDEAASLHARGLAIKQAALEPSHPELGVSFHNLGDIAYKRGRYEEAEEYFRRAQEIFEQTLPAEHPFLGYSFAARALVASDIGDAERAEAFFRRALEIRSRAHPPGHPTVQEVVAGFARLLERQGRGEDARALLARFPAGMEEPDV